MSEIVNRWDKPGIPRKGWIHQGVVDEGDAIHTCEMCGKEEIRFVHVMFHPLEGMQLAVGCVCAGKMIDDYELPRLKEKSVRNLANRKNKWLTRKWGVNAKGNHALKIGENRFLVYKTKYGQWSWAVNGNFCLEYFKTMDEAKMNLFHHCFEK